MGLSSLITTLLVTALVLSGVCSLEQQQKQLLRRPYQRRIETQEIESGLFSISVSPPADYKNAETRRNRILEETNSCVLYLEDIYYHNEDPHNREERWVCTFDGYVTEKGNGPSPYSFYVDGDIDKINEFLDGIVSGSHTLNWDSPELIGLDEEANTITLKADISEYQNSLWIDAIVDEPNERKLQFLASTHGAKRTLVIRIVGDGIGPSDDLTQLREEIFGNEIGLKSQMNACSHGKLTIEPYQGTTGGVFENTIYGGVVELRIGTNPTGTSDKVMENDAIAAAWYVFGDLRLQFDLVMFVMPPGIEPDFAAYAYIGTQFSYYSDDAVRDTMVQMHEVGHNLGLQHSGQGHEEYGDSSGYMGYADAMDPLMCYNAVNNYQLGWYSAHSFTPTSDGGRGGTFLITGVHRYDPDDTEKFVSLRLVQESMPKDYYIGYNRAEGINSDSQEDRDKVIIYLKDGDIRESVISWKKGVLSIGETYVIEDYDASGRYVTVTFTGVVEHAAVVEVLPESSESPTSTPLPSYSPTIKPSYRPSTDPTLSPSHAPSNKPSDMPSATPSISSRPTISAIPSSNPSARPSSTPTISPAPTISIMPSSLPSASPSSAPTISPAPTVSPAPSKSPSQMPTGSPSTSPTHMPSTSPSSPPTEFDCVEDLSMKIVIKTDMFPEETSWKLKPTGGAPLVDVSANHYSEQTTKYSYNYCLEYDTCYRFSIFDEAADGMGNKPDGPSGKSGFYSIHLGDNILVNRRGDWGSRRSHRFCTPADASLIVGDELSVGDASNAEAGNAGLYVDLSEAGDFHTSEPDDGDDSDNNSMRH